MSPFSHQVSVVVTQQYWERVSIVSLQRDVLSRPATYPDRMRRSTGRKHTLEQTVKTQGELSARLEFRNDGFINLGTTCLTKL